MPVVGYFNMGRASSVLEDSFRQGLADAGYVEGRNVAIIFRSAEGQYNKLRPLAADLVGRQVSVIVAIGALSPALEAKALTATIPIVVASGGDPVKYGLPASLNHPGGTVTGVTWISAQLVGKRLDLLHEMVPQATTVAYLSGGPAYRRFEDEEPELVCGRECPKLQIVVVEARSESDIEAAFVRVVEGGAGALILSSVPPNFNFNSRKIVGLAARHKIPTIYPYRNYVRDGGLMSYGTDTSGILKGADPADLPIAQPTKFPLVINAKTAKTLGLEVPSTLFIQADDVIE